MSAEAAGRQHPFVKQCRAVAAERAAPGTVLLDGEHVIADALAAGLSFDGLLTSTPEHPTARAAAARGIRVIPADRTALDAASPVRSPSGLVALARWAPLEPDRVLDAPAPVVIGLVGVQDPGNVGAIIRSAEALGASGVIALDGTADPAGWKALRGAMGSTFRLPIGRGDLEATLAAARTRGIRVAATVPMGGRPIAAATLQPPILILLGGEGPGLSDRVVGAADILVTIPMRGAANSLNVAVSAALILWEATRTPPPS